MEENKTEGHIVEATVHIMNWCTESQTEVMKVTKQHWYIREGTRKTLQTIDQYPISYIVLVRY